LPPKIKQNLTRHLEGVTNRPDLVNFYRPQFETTKKHHENFLNFKPKGHKQLLENKQTHKLPIYYVNAHGSETGELFKLGDNQWVIFSTQSKCHSYGLKEIQSLLKSGEYLFSTIAPYEIKGPGSSFYDLFLGYSPPYNSIFKNNVKIKNRPTKLSSFINGKTGVFVVGSCRVPRRKSLPKSEQVCRYGEIANINPNLCLKNSRGVSAANVVRMRTLKNRNLVKHYGYGALNNRNLELERFMKRPNSELSNQEREWKRTIGRTFLLSLNKRREAARKIQSSFRKYINLPKETKNYKKGLRRGRREAASKILENIIAEKKESSLHGCINMKAKGGCFGRRRKVVPI
jgi:hypothetical protein